MTISDYINRQITAFKKIALRDFIIDFQAQFYPEQDISFMDYFLELSQEENQGQFVVHHDKLFEYGATVSKQSNHTKERLDAHCMAENEDYLLTKFREQLPSGAKHKNVYMLTPECFKTILIGATKHKKHTTDVLKYRKYYLFLEKVVNYYMKYQLGLEKAMSVAKDGTIQQQSERIDTLITETRSQSAQIATQSANIERLLAYSGDIQQELGEVHGEVLDITHEFGRVHDVFEEVHDQLVSTKNTVKVIADHLEEKSFTSTKNPESQGLHHHALVMYKKFGRNYTINNVAGQSHYVDGRKKELEAEGYTTMIDKFYQANPIDFRRNVQQAVNNHIDSVLAPINAPIIVAREELKREIDESNLMLQEDIPVWNEQLHERVRVLNLTATGSDIIRLANNGKRYAWRRNRTFERVRFYETEKRNYLGEVRNSKFKLKTLPIEVCSRYIVWKPNSLISFKALQDLIFEVNDTTQKSPYQSDEE